MICGKELRGGGCSEIFNNYDAESWEKLDLLTLLEKRFKFQGRNLNFAMI